MGTEGSCVVGRGWSGGVELGAAHQLAGMHSRPAFLGICMVMGWGVMRWHGWSMHWRWKVVEHK